jgi:hypothetical protein
LTGGTKWYLSEDCLLAAKRTMYAVEYRRFYLRDLEYIMAWPRTSWRWRMIIPGAIFVALGVSFWVGVSYTSGAIFTGLGVAWVGLEFALGPTAKSRIHTVGATVDLPLVKRMRSAQNVLGTIDAAVRATRIVEQPSAAARIFPQAQSNAEIVSQSSVTAAAATQTNAF